MPVMEIINSYSDFLGKVEKKLNLSTKEKTLIRRAYLLSNFKFKNITRDSWENYFEHLERTALIILNEFDNPTVNQIVLALLHDIWEDRLLNDVNTLLFLFSEEMKNKVLTLSRNDERLWTNISKLNRKKAYFERLVNHNNEDVLKVKLADRIDNLRTIACWPKEKILKKLQETEKYIVPIAEKLWAKYKRILLWEITKVKQLLNLSN